MQFITPEDRKKVEDKFFKDPDWHIVQEAVIRRLRALEGLASIDVTLPAEDVKCQVKGHKVAQDVLLEFFTECAIIAPDSRVSLSESDFR